MMEVDEENIREIPLPLSHLPEIPQILEKRNNVIEMQPLRTIKPEDLQMTGPNQKNEDNENENEIHNKSDDEIVILISDDESVILISDDEEESHEECHRIRKCLGDTNKAGTSNLKSPSSTPNRVKNIKSCLKRPHSRELQTISPTMKHERGKEEHKRQFQSDEHRRVEPYSPETYWQYSLTTLTNAINNEKKLNIPIIDDFLRSCIIDWIIKVNGRKSPLIVQYAQWYFDALLSVKRIHTEEMQLFATACYWVAQKVDGHFYRASTLVAYPENNFTCNRLLAAKSQLLLALNFPNAPIIPQEFISYLSFWCDGSETKEIEKGATFICMAGIMVDINLCDMWPSVLAAASLLNAVILLRKKECEVKLKRNLIYKYAEKKFPNIDSICSIQRAAVQLISSPSYENKALFWRYSRPPNNIAEKIAISVNEFAASTTHRSQSSC